MAENVGAWERQAFYYADMAWAAAMPSSTDFSKIRENSPSIPHVIPALIPPPGGMGSGLPFPHYTEYTIGRSGGAFDTVHPITLESFVDMIILLTQSLCFIDVNTDYLFGTHDAITAGNLIWNSDGQDKCAGVVIRSDPNAAANVGGCLYAESALLTGMDIDIPIATPGETAGLCSMTLHWIARDTTRIQDFATALSGTADTAAMLSTKDCVFKIAGGAMAYLNASISITTGAALNPSGGGGYASGFTLGMFNISGSVTGFRDNTAGSYSELVLDAAEGTTPLLLSFELGTAGATGIISLPALILPPPPAGELNGLLTDTVNFALVHDSATNNPFIQLEDALATQFYTAP